MSEAGPGARRYPSLGLGRQPGGRSPMVLHLHASHGPHPILVAMAELRDTLWRAADKLRGSMDAGQYKDVVLGLVFLRHAAGPARWDQIAAAANAEDERLGQLVGAAL